MDFSSKRLKASLPGSSMPYCKTFQPNLVSVKPLSYIDFSMIYAILDRWIKSTFDPRRLKLLQSKGYSDFNFLELPPQVPRFLGVSASIFLLIAPTQVLTNSVF
jgi:hypothetical protein